MLEWPVLGLWELGRALWAMGSSFGTRALGWTKRVNMSPGL